MRSDNHDDASFSVSLPIGAAVSAALLAVAAGAAVLLLGLGRNGDESETSGSASKSGKSSSGKNFFRRVGILGLVTLIENDATRKVVVAVLKAMARRA
jgi:hypothetical protein